MIHFDFISDGSDTKGVVGQFSVMFFSRDLSGIGLTQFALRDFGVFAEI